MQNPTINELLADDHSDLDGTLGELFQALESANIERIHEKLDFFWARLAMHIRAEHLHLFPAVLAACESEQRSVRVIAKETAQNVIARLREDHDFFMHELAAAIKRLRVLRESKTNARRELLRIRASVAAVRRRLEAHNEREEAGVYRWADALLDASERAALSDRMRKEIENLPPRFGES